MAVAVAVRSVALRKIGALEDGARLFQELLPAI
jgi:hypothetical protein